MDHNEIINEFLDGNLNPELENEFIAQLTTSEDFRSEFKKYLAIEKSLRTDAQGITPTAKSTMAVFSSLGFNPHGSIAGSTITYAIAQLFSKYSQGIIGGIIASALTALIFLLQFSNTTDLNNSNTLTASKDVKSNVSHLTDGEKSEELTQSREIEQPQPLKSTSISSIIHTTNDSKKILSSDTAELIQNVDYYINENYIQSNQVLYLPAKVIHIGKDTSPINVSITQNEFVTIDKDKIGLSFQLFGNNYVSLQKSDVQFYSRPRFSNSGIGLSYKIADDFELISDFRQEYFYQRFEGYDSEGYKVLYSQYPNFYTLSGGIKWNVMKIDCLNLNVGLSIGGNQYGMISRGLAGIDWYISDDYKIIIGLESSIFRYLHDNNPFYSYKIGLMYGIGFDL